MSLINFDLAKSGLRLEEVLNSPRSLLALQHTGIEASELNEVNERQIAKFLRDREKGKPVPQELLKARVEAARTNRLHKLQIVCQARQEIIDISVR